MNDIIQYLTFMLFGSEDRTRISLVVFAACVPIGIMVAKMPPELSIVFWVLMIFAWRWMILDIKKKLDGFFKQ